MELPRAKVWFPRRIVLHPLVQTGQSSSTNCGQFAQLGATSRRTVEEDWDPQLLTNPSPHSMDDVHAVVQRQPAEGHDGYHVRCTNSWMFSMVLSEVNERACGSDRPKRGFGDCVDATHEGEHRAVMRAIRVHVQQVCPGRRCDDGSKRFDHVLIAAFAEIRYALDKARHG